LHLTVVLLIEELINGKRSTFHTARHSAFVSVKERMNIWPILVRALARMSLSLNRSRSGHQ
jgi:hypothetical protein